MPGPLADSGGQALNLLQQGKLVEAERICQRILNQRPNDFDAIYLLGVIAAQAGQAERAAELMGAAIALRPNDAEARNNLGNVLADLGRFDAALSNYASAIALRPDFAEAWFNRAGTLNDLGRPEAALADYNQAINLRPDHAEAEFNRGNVLRRLGRPADALASYERAIAARPEHADAHNNRGNALRDLGRFVDALSAYDRAIASRPDFAAAYYNRGIVLRDLARSEEAIASFDQAIVLSPGLAEAHNNRGNALRHLGRFDEASKSYSQAIAVKPDYAEAYYGRGTVLWDLGRPEVALSNYDRAIALKPDFAEANYNKGICQLAMGDFDRGWAGFEWRWKVNAAPKGRDFPARPWTGDFPIEGKTILVSAEQGLGDVLQFCRYVPLLAARASVVLEVPRPLVRLMSGLKGDVRIIAAGDTLPRFDAWIPMMSLPLAFHTTVATIPAEVPYLYSDPERSAIWRQRVAGLPGRKIGLVWAGSPRIEQPRAHAMDGRRSITPEHFSPLAAVAGLCLISLQKSELSHAPPPDGMVLHDWTNELADFADTAALVDALDLVISVDTSVVHLAGALGKAVWVLNRYDQCWRWLRDRTDSPWYPTARLFHQPTPGDWAAVIRDVSEALRTA